MPNYLYFERENAPLPQRFAVERREEFDDNVVGVGDWERLTEMLLRVLELAGDDDRGIREAVIDELLQLDRYNGDRDGMPASEAARVDAPTRTTAELILLLLLALLRRQAPVRHRQPGQPGQPGTPGQKCPQVFISHRQSDTGYALRMARLAAQEGFRYWVDVLDPGLQWLNRAVIPAYLVPLLTACIIEMGIINCTHVLACMTPNTRGSLWLPYEYGRITEMPRFYNRACAWRHPDLAVADFPEYMFLGEIARNEPEIEGWLRAEYAVWARSHCTKPVLPPDVRDLRLPEGKDTVVQAPSSKEELTRLVEGILDFEAALAAGLPLEKAVEVLKPIRFKKTGGGKAETGEEG